MYVCLCAGDVVAQCKVSGPVSAAVAFDHQHRLVFVATLSGQLQAFLVSDHHLSLWYEAFRPCLQDESRTVEIQIDSWQAT